ncbi:late histone H2B.L4-like [Cervus canadensis]|uniref:late histone H2B.L4-like n=1 Tax=Cervus canadensis TaxID=1574408 RepID=UPI001CA32F0A|nr:late histone H2B.L4-like [Cervus canadensis]
MAQPSSDNSEEDLGTNETGTSKVEPSETEPSETETSETEPSEPEPYGAEPKKAKQKTAKGRRHRHRLRHRRRCLDNFASFATYFPRVLRQVHTGLSLSHEAVNVMDSLVKDMFERIAEEAGHLARSNKHCTITSGEIQTAVHLLLPGEICKYAVSEATKSVIRYNTRR